MFAAIPYPVAPVHGQEQTGIDSSDEPFNVYIPDMMIAGLTYPGIVVLAEPAGRQTIITLAGTDAAIRMPDTISVERGNNHGIFEMEIGEDVSGSIMVHAAAHDHLSTDSAIIHSAAESRTRLAIVGPTTDDGDLINTQSGSIPVYVYIVDEHGLPVPADDDANVLLVSSSDDITFHESGVQASEARLVIGHGEYSAMAALDVTGDGRIYAVSDGRPGDEINIRYKSQEEVLRMAISPDIIQRNSYAYYYVWLEKDGMQYIPPGSHEVTITTSSTSTATFERGISPGSDGESRVNYMFEGIARGILYTGSSGTATITASVPHIGAAEAGITITDLPQAEYGMPLSQMESSFLSLDVYPENPIGRAWGVLSAYSAVSDVIVPRVSDAAESASPAAGRNGSVPDAQDTDSMPDARSMGSSSDDSEYAGALQLGGARMVQVPEDARRLVPIPFPHDTEIILAGDDGITHEERIRTFGRSTGASGISSVYAIEFPIDASTSGRHWIVAHENNMFGASRVFATPQEPEEPYRIHVKPLPIQAGSHGDLAMVFLTDRQGYIVDYSSSMDNGNRVSISASRSDAGLEDPVLLSDSVIILSGNHTSNEMEVFAHAPDLLSARAVISSVDVSQKGISLWLPDRVHITEEFPVVVHDIDAGGNPVGVAGDIEIASHQITLHRARGQMLLLTDSVGESDVTVVSEDAYLDTERMTSFINNATGDIRVDVLVETSVKGHTKPYSIHVGDSIIIDVAAEAMAEPVVSVAGDGLDFVRNDLGQYVAVPTDYGRYEVTVSVSGKGFVPYKDILSVQVSEVPKTVSYSVATDDGFLLNPTVTIRKASAGAGIQPTEYLLHDGVSVAVSSGTYIIDVNEAVTFDEGRTYDLHSMTVNGEDIKFSSGFTMPILGDTTIEAAYIREIHVEMHNEFDSDVESVLRHYDTRGSGIYRYGDVVVLEAPVIYEYGMIRHMPYKWHGLPHDATMSEDMTVVSFEAMESVSGYVLYERDHTLLYVLVAAAVIAAPLIVRAQMPHLLTDAGNAIASVRLRRDRSR